MWELDVRYGQYKYRKEFIMTVVERIKAGESMGTLATELCIQYGTIYAWKKRYIDSGLKDKTEGNKRLHSRKGGFKHDKELISNVVNRIQNGEKVANLSRELGINYHTINAWKMKYLG